MKLVFTSFYLIYFYLFCFEQKTLDKQEHHVSLCEAAGTQ